MSRDETNRVLMEIFEMMAGNGGFGVKMGNFYANVIILVVMFLSSFLRLTQFVMKFLKTSTLNTI